jgi:hypothetical protein
LSTPDNTWVYNVAMNILIVRDQTTRADIKKIADETFGDMAKAVVDIKQGVMAIGSELHADAETALIEKEGSLHEDVWGINFYPSEDGDEFIEFDSMINIKPSLGNRSRDVEDNNVRGKIREIVSKMVK